MVSAAAWQGEPPWDLSRAAGRTERCLHGSPALLVLWPALVPTRTMALSSSVLLAFGEPDTWKAEGSAPGACPRCLSVRRGTCDEIRVVYFWQEIREVGLCVSRETRRGLRSESYCWLVNMDHWDGCCWPNLSPVRPLFLLVILMAKKQPPKQSMSEALEPMNLIT